MGSPLSEGVDEERKSVKAIETKMEADSAGSEQAKNTNNLKVKERRQKKLEQQVAEHLLAKAIVTETIKEAAAPNLKMLMRKQRKLEE